ncbi:protein-tyrosine phosphatase family protein [Piscinibacter koreensis]|uniref:Dual specificity protein phosphatase family protein n=1 Tax=Piscinibacter koreensis TaxID=2742824 RepID=A0A7Y6NLT2_9BURK|nr:dual specificity protein phosphatase [Schlegelella koreensis]NUZ05543.1 dual specificity protein phosphatase family protein [Schlegelella koreensis]
MTWQPNFDWITDTLAVGGSFPTERAEALAREHRFQAIVDLREEAKDDEHVLRRHGITLLHLPTPDLCGVDAEHLDRAVEFVSAHLDRGERVLVHCQHGIGRSAITALCALVHRGMPPLDALGLMKDRRDLVSPSPSQFECWAGWLERERAKRDVAWSVPTFDEFKLIAYRHLMRSA